MKMPKGFLNSQDCTYSAGLEWLQSKYPDAEYTYKTSWVTGNSMVKVNGDLALKEEKMTSLGYKLCNSFSYEWDEENPEVTENV
jgi:hypothetical protein